MAASIKDQINDLFGKLNPGVTIGLDIGSHSVKVCEMSGSLSKPKIEKFGIFTLSEAAIIEDEIQKPSEIVEGVLEALDQAGISSKSMCLGLFGPNTMTKRLNVPEGTKDEVEDQILWEAEQYITFGADDSQIDHFIIGDNEGGGKDAIVVAAKTDLVEGVTELLKDANLQVKIVDLNVIAVSNAFELTLGDHLEELSQGALILDFGAQTTKVIVYKKGGPIFTKEVPVGGSLVTEEIQRQMGVSYEEAEDLKTTTDDNGNLPEEILTIINSQLDQQLAEIKKSINFYVTQGSAEKVEVCFICGGSSLLPGLTEKLSMIAGIQVERLNILDSVKVDVDKLGVDPEHFAAIATTVMGLAMRKFEK